MRPVRVTAFAPASVANVATGFDILGFSFAEAGDEVIVQKTEDTAIRIERVEARDKIFPKADLAKVPLDAASNTATVGLLALWNEIRPRFGLSLVVKKGIPLASGMGGSAASACAALVAANRFLDQPLPVEKLLEYAALGEAAASGSLHYDNVGPSLYGGLVLTRPHATHKVLSIPIPDDLTCVLVHPHLKVETRAARAALAPQVPTATVIAQTANLASLLVACTKPDKTLLKDGLSDRWIEPQRAGLVKGFAAAKAAWTRTGAWGGSLSGSGPTVFAWTDPGEPALQTLAAIQAAFLAEGVSSDGWIAPPGGAGARVLKEDF